MSCEMQKGRWTEVEQSGGYQRVGGWEEVGGEEDRQRPSRGENHSSMKGKYSSAVAHSRVILVNNSVFVHFKNNRKVFHVLMINISDDGYTPHLIIIQCIHVSKHHAVPRIYLC